MIPRFVQIRASGPLIATLLGLFLLFTAQAVTAQTGTIEGQVIGQATGQPVAGVQVHIPALGVGSFTNTQGRFTLSNVPVGEVTVRAEMIGYAPATSTLSISAGEEATVDFTLARAAIGLDDVVVTGTVGGTQRRAVGNVVDRLSASDLAEITPSTNVNQLIGQRSPGVVLLGSAGGVGVGQRIRIRGAGSMGLSNDPIVYIDGIRMDSRATGGPGQRGGSTISRLNDIAPEDIESIEIIKGPAAATLYGTEASNGVIQIITKRGASGDMRIDVTARTGTHWLWNPAGRQGLTWATDPNTGELHSFNVYEYEKEHGLGDIFTYGSIQSYQANLSGGTDAVRYFLSAGWNDEVGVRKENWDERLNLRGNVDLGLTDNLRLSANLGFVRGDTRLANGGFNNDPFSNIFWASPLPSRLELNRGYFRAPPEEWVKIQHTSNLNRFTGSFEISHDLFDWFSHRLVTGLDTNEERNVSLTPRQPEGRAHFFGNDALGSKSVNHGSRQFVTLDYSASAQRDINPRLHSVTSFGLQYYKSETLQIGSSGNDMPAPQMTTVSSAANSSGSESFSENATVGVFIQQQFGWENRAFITAAVRADDNSAFGAEFDAAIYPKLSATWVISEESFWNFDRVEQLRLRAAWGAAGQQPGTFDATQLLSPSIGYQDQPILRPSSFGNPALEPERAEELELGFDAEFLEGRLGVIYTRFQRNTKNAIVSRGLPRSMGWPGSQIVNLGRVEGWGNELAVDLRVIETGRLSWELGTQFSTYGNKILDLGPGTDAIGNHRVGYGIQDIYYQTVVHAEVDQSGSLVSEPLCDGGTGPIGVDQGGEPVPCSSAPQVRWGPSQPTWDLGINSTFSIGAFRFYGRIDAVGGHYQQDSSSPANITSNVLTYLSNTRTDPMVEAYKVVPRGPLGTYKGDFARLRELSATYNLPEHLASRVGASRGTITLAGRNLMMLWTAEHGWSTSRDGRVDMPIGDGHTWDPETRAQGNLSTNFQTVMPPMASANLTVRFSF